VEGGLPHIYAGEEEGLTGESSQMGVNQELLFLSCRNGDWVPGINRSRSTCQLTLEAACWLPHLQDKWLCCNSKRGEVGRI
jgi:hypothetical protein